MEIYRIFGQEIFEKTSTKNSRENCRDIYGGGRYIYIYIYREFLEDIFEEIPEKSKRIPEIFSIAILGKGIL